MIVFIVLIAIVALMIFAHRHSGPAQLAVIAGGYVYHTFGGWLTDTVMANVNGLAQDIVSSVIFLILVVGVPLLLYFKSPKGRVGLIHLIETAIFAAVLVLMAAPIIGQWVAFDELTQQIVAWVNNNIQFVSVAGIISAYYDIFFSAGD